MLTSMLLLLVGFFILIKGASYFVDGASSLAANLKVSKTIIAITIVAFGTSIPEFAISLKSVIDGSGGFVVGNVIGSNIINILLILGSSSIIRPLLVKKDTINMEMPTLLLISSMLWIILYRLINDTRVNVITRADGMLLLLGFSIFVYYLIFAIKKRKNKEESKPKYTTKKSIFWSIVGVVCVILGSKLVVNSATEIALFLGASERLIGLTIIALGTSLPELVTSIVAAKKDEADLAIGNIVGSNIFNIGVVLALPIFLFGDIIPGRFNMLDINVMILSTVVLFCFSAGDGKISRSEGLIMLILFALYYGYIIMEGVI